MPICEVCRHAFQGVRCPMCGTVAARRRPVIAAPPLEGVALGRRVAVPARNGPHAAVPLPVQALRREARMNGNGGVVEGTVVQIQGPAQVAPPPNPWRCACAALAMIVLLPFMIGLWAILLAIRIALSILGLGGRGRGRRSIIDDLVLYRGFSILTRRPDPIPIYHYVIQTPIGSVMARQEGEFVDGRIFLGHRVRLRGRERGGVLVIDQGWNETLQAELTPKRGPWRALFVVLLAILVFEIALASSAAFPTVGAGITDLWR